MLSNLKRTKTTEGHRLSVQYSSSTVVRIPPCKVLTRHKDNDMLKCQEKQNREQSRKYSTDKIQSEQFHNTDVLQH